MGKRGGGKRKKTDAMPVVDRSYIQGLIDKVDKLHYGEVWKLRSKALVSLLYLSARRISELVGRVFPEPRKAKNLSPPPIDVYSGVKLKDFSEDIIAGRPVLSFNFRILKKGTRKLKCSCGMVNTVKTRFCKDCGDPLLSAVLIAPKPVPTSKIIRKKDPFAQHILNWINYLRKKGYSEDVKVFNITRQRAYQIMRELDNEINNHWFRHQRTTHLSETMDVWDLKEFREDETIQPASDYVHRAPGRQLEKIEKADNLWSKSSG